MKHILNYQDYNEGLKEIFYGALLFLASCTNCTVTDPSGNRVITPAEMTIVGKVEEQRFLPNKGDYYQLIKVKGNDGNTYSYKITNTYLTSKSWEINKGDSVKMIFDENGDSHIYKK